MRTIGLVCAVVCLLLAGTAWSGQKSDTRTYSTGQFVVNCTSKGQVCSPAKKLQLTPPKSGTVTSVRYTTPPTHSSAVAVQIVRDGKVLATSPRLEAGVRSVQFNPHISVPKGTSNLKFRAKGFLGGCNTGRVGSWGGKITVTVTLKKG